ncbi:MAG: hypothetical protein KDD65_10795 [Bacteroidetes bacterium]|nr:hypothetical protein [Bacteroidota bacterium]
MRTKTPLLALALAAGTGSAGAQDLLDLYRINRMHSLSRVVEDSLLPARPPQNVGTRFTELAYWPSPATPNDAVTPVPVVVVNRFQKVPKLGRNWFQNRFAIQQWAYEGSNRLTPIDTMYTRELRSRLEAHFGSPTQTLADQGLLYKLKLDEYVQFEYWFVINDTIPLVVMDVNGPFERGVVVATDESHREILNRVKDAFLNRLVLDPRRKAYADYYFENELGSWFLTGFDGNRYFLNVVDPRRVPPGRPVAPIRN